MLRAAILLVILCSPAWAGDVDVPARSGALAAALENAAAGDVLTLAPGTHAGGITIDRPLQITGTGAVLVGPGSGSVVTVAAPDVSIRGLVIRGSGSSHDTIDAGITLTKLASRAMVEGNHLTGNLYGIDVHGARNAVVRGNVIEGRRDHRVNDRGNGIYVWNAPGTVIEANQISWGRDGIFVNTSRRNTLRANQFRDVRFAVHSMYANEMLVEDNLSEGNDLGYAVMYSKRARLLRNVSIDDAEHGIMLNYTNQSVVEGNLVRDGKTRCAFLYNAHKNRISGNRFERCGIGIHFTAGSERNEISGNAFVGNRVQVKYVGSRWVDWSNGGRGNHWSDFAAFDLDGDGIADTHFRPNDLMDQILWRQPGAKLLLGSPAVQLVRWSQRAFPALLPGGVIDTAPLMRAPVLDLPQLEKRNAG